MWKRKMAKVGGVYPCQTKMYAKNSEARVFITVNKMYLQPLGEMTEEDARKEGGFTLDEFKAVWISINGQWNDDDEPYVLEFKKVGKLEDKG